MQLPDEEVTINSHMFDDLMTNCEEESKEFEVMSKQSSKNTIVVESHDPIDDTICSSQNF